MDKPMRGMCALKQAGYLRPNQSFVCIKAYTAWMVQSELCLVQSKYSKNGTVSKHDMDWAYLNSVFLKANTTWMIISKFCLLQRQTNQWSEFCLL